MARNICVCIFSKLLSARTQQSGQLDKCQQQNAKMAHQIQNAILYSISPLSLCLLFVVDVSGRVEMLKHFEALKRKMFIGILHT